MIKTFIFVEDGSVDLDELKNSVGDDVLVVTYRQGLRLRKFSSRKSLSHNGTINLIMRQRKFLKGSSVAATK